MLALGALLPVNVTAAEYQRDEAIAPESRRDFRLILNYDLGV